MAGGDEEQCLALQRAGVAALVTALADVAQGVVDVVASAADVAPCGVGAGEAITDAVRRCRVGGILGRVERDLVHGDGVAVVLVDDGERLHRVGQENCERGQSVRGRVLYGGIEVAAFEVQPAERVVVLVDADRRSRPLSDASRRRGGQWFTW